MKRAFNISINAESERSAVAAIAQLVAGGERLAIRRQHFSDARDLLAKIKQQNPKLEQSNVLFSGVGLRLQRIDSDIAEGVMLKLLRSGIVSLPIHDSFVVRQKDSQALSAVMDEKLFLKLRSIS